MDGVLEKKNEREILSRRKRLRQNPKLQEILSMFWMILSMGSEDREVLFRDEFVNFLYLLQSALLGPENVCEHEVGSAGELEFIQNVGYYGECSEFAFNDIMAECVECWSDVESPTFFPAFAWTLFKSIVHVNEKIPRFKEQKSIRMIPTGDGMETDVTTTYHDDLPLRAKMLKIVKWAKENPHVDAEAKKRMESRRKGQSFSKERSNELFDMCVIHQHILDQEAAGKLISAQGRMTPTSKNRNALTRTLSMRRARSFELGSDCSLTDEESEISLKSFATGVNTSDVKSENQPPPQPNIFKRSKSRQIMDEELVEPDIKMETVPEKSPIKVALRNKTPSRPKRINAVEKSGMTVKEPPQVDNYSVGSGSVGSGSLDSGSVGIRRAPAPKKREILVKENSKIANRLKLDPDTSKDKEDDPFEEIVRYDDEARSVLSRQGSVLSRQGSVLSRQSSRVFSRQNSAAPPVSSPTPSIQRSRAPLSRTTSVVTNITFDGDDFNSLDGDMDGDVENKTVSSVSNASEAVTEKSLSVSVRSIREADTETMTDTVTETAPDIFSPDQKAELVAKLEKPARVETVAPLRRGSLAKPVLVEYLMRSQSQIEWDDRSPMNDIESEDVSRASNEVGDNTAGGVSLPLTPRRDDKLNSDHNKEVEHNYDHNDDVCHDDNSNADYISNLEMEAYDDLHEGRSVQPSLETSVESPLDLVAGELSIGPSVNPGSMSKYSHHIDEEEVFKESVEQYVTELPENTPALPSKMSRRRRVNVSVKVTPKMALAKQVINKKKKTRKLLQGKKFLREKKKFTNEQKRGQTPMQRSIAAKTQVPNAPGKYAVPANDKTTKTDNANIEYLMDKVVNNSKVKAAERKTGLDSIAIDVGAMKMEREESCKTIDDSCPLSPESPTHVMVHYGPESPSNPINGKRRVKAMGGGAKAMVAASRLRKKKGGIGLDEGSLVEGARVDVDSVLSEPSEPSSVGVYHLEDYTADEKNTIKVLDLFNMKKGLIRCSYLNLHNAEGLPEFIYVSKKGPNSMAERISNGSAEVTEWDKFMIRFVGMIDSHISSTLSKSNTAKISLKTLMNQLMSLQTICSKEHRFRRLSLEFDVPTIGDRIDELHILSEIYLKREKLIRDVMTDTAAILQKDIEVKKGNLLFETISVGSDKKKFPVIDDSQTVHTTASDAASSIGGSSCSTNQKAIKSRKRWIDKVHASSKQHNVSPPRSVASASNPSRSFLLPDTNKNLIASPQAEVRSISDSDVHSVGGHSQSHSVSHSIGGHSVGQSVDNSVLSDVSYYVDMHPVVAGSVTLSSHHTDQSFHSHSQSSHSQSLSPIQMMAQYRRSQSANTRHRPNNSLPLVKPYASKVEQSFMTEGNHSQSQDHLLFKTTKLVTNNSTVSRPHTASFAPHQTMSFYPEASANCEDAINYHSDSPYIPWVPKGGMKLMVSDKTDVLNGWRERRAIGDYVETTRSSTVRKRTEVVRDSFESFTKANPNFSMTSSVKLSQQDP